MEKVTEDPEDYFFEPWVVIKMVDDVLPEAAEWLRTKLEAPRSQGGGDLLVRPVITKAKEKSRLYISARPEKMMVAAELMDLKKQYKDGYYRDFNIDDYESFQGSDDMDTFFTMTEKLKIINYILGTIRALPDDSCIPGYSNATLYHGKSILRKYQSSGIVEEVFPLHEDEKLKRLATDWWKSPFGQQPLNQIRDYFGEKIALYFAFLGVYTVSLIPPAFIGIIYFITSWKNIYREAIFAVFNLVWTTIFLECWKRYCSELSFRWGTINMVKEFEEPRPSYHGRLGINSVTGRKEPIYPKWKQRIRFYGITVPVICFCLVIAFEAMLLYFQMQEWANALYEKDPSYLNYANMMAFPSVLYAVAVCVMNIIYNKLIRKLNNMENHRLQSSYDNHLIVKMVLFNFVNCFMSLFYNAFYLQDMALLRSDLVALLITQQVVDQLQETVVPFLLHRNRAKKVAKMIVAYSKEQRVDDTPETDVSIELRKKANIEMIMDPCVTLDDHLEMFLQFGYIYLFSSVYPLAAFWALVNNIFEIRTDAFKMCNVFMRPFPRSASSIGAWQAMFELMDFVAVITNCALIGMNPEVQKLLPGHQTPVQLVLIVVVLEHFILALKALIAFMIPDAPKWVQLEVAKSQFEAKQAVEKVKIQKSSQRKLTRKPTIDKQEI